MFLVCLFLAQSLAQGAEIVIESGQDSDKVIKVGPGVDDGRAEGGIDIESAPGNDTVMQVRPTPENNRPDSGTIIVSPRIHVGE